MNALTSFPSLINPAVSNVPVGRFEALSVAGSEVAELLKQLDNRNARECFAKLIAIQPRLQAERLAADRAMVALTGAKAEVRRINAIAGTMIDIAVGLGRLLGYEDITDFENQDDAWLFTIQGLITALRTRGELGRVLADRFSEVLLEMEAAKTGLARATADYARATAAFSVEYRELAATIAFGRAVLTQLGISPRRVAPKKKAKATESAPAPAPTAATAPL